MMTSSPKYPEKNRTRRLVIYRHLSQASCLWGTLFCLFLFLFTAVLRVLSTPQISGHGANSSLVPGAMAFVAAWLSITTLFLPLAWLRRTSARALLMQNRSLIERTYVCCAGGRLWLTIVAMSVLLPEPGTAIATRPMIVFLMIAAGIAGALADCCATFISLIALNRKSASWNV